MKILLIVDDFKGGAGNVAQILSRELYFKKFDVTLALFNKNSLPRYNLPADIKIVDLPLNNLNNKSKIKKVFKQVKLIKSLVFEERPDIVISFINNNNSLTGLALLGKKIPFLASERSNPFLTPTSKFWRSLRTFAYLNSTKVVVQSKSFIGFDQNLHNKKSIVIPNPILKPKSYKTDYTNNETLKLISVGRLNPVKGFDQLIKAFYMLSQENLNLSLTIVGEGQERANLENLIEMYKLNEKVTLAGHCSNIHEILINHDIYVMSSRVEGFPNALSEAMAVGLSVVAFECNQAVNDLIKNGKNGLLAEANNIEDLVKKVRLLVENTSLRMSLGKEAQKVVEEYSTEKIINQWVNLIKQVS